MITFILQAITMPKINIEIPDTNDSVSRPVAIEAARKALTMTGLPLTTPILLPSLTEANQQWNSSIDSEQPNIAVFDSGDLLRIEVNEEVHNDTLLTIRGDVVEHPFLFKDPILDIYLRPVYARREVTINFRYMCKNINRAEMWRQGIQQKISQDNIEQVFPINYHYLIPFEFMHILEYLHGLREQQAGYGDTFKDYFKNNALPIIGESTNLSGAVSAMAVKQTQGRVVGWFDFEGAPEKAGRENDAELVSISFSYKFQYDKPISVEMRYPNVVHNQLIDKKYRETGRNEVAYNPSTYDSYRSLSNKHLGAFEIQRPMLVQSLANGFSIPAWDEFIPDSVFPDTRRVFNALFTVNPLDRRECIKIDEFKGYEFDPAVKRLLKQEFPYMTTYLKSIFNLALYEEGSFFFDKALTVDKDGVVRALIDLDLRKTYRLRLSVITDLSLLDKTTLDRIRKEGEGLTKIIEYIDPTVKKPDLIGGKVYPGKDLDKAKDQINRDKAGNGQQYGWSTVATLFVETELEKEQ